MTLPEAGQATEAVAGLGVVDGGSAAGEAVGEAVGVGLGGAGAAGAEGAEAAGELAGVGGPEDVAGPGDWPAEQPARTNRMAAAQARR